MKNLNAIFKRDGFFVSKNIFSAKEIEFFNKKVDNFINKKIKNSKKNTHFIKKNILSSAHNISNFDLVRLLQKNNKIQKISKAILGNKIKKFGAELFAKPPKVGRAIPVHQDNFYWCTEKGSGITIWIALNDSSKKNGGIFYYKGSQQLGLLEHEISYVPGTSQKIKYPNSMKIFKKVYPKLKAGDCLIHSSLVVHGSERNLSHKPRRGFTLRFIAQNDKFDVFKMRNYKKSLKKSIRGK